MDERVKLFVLKDNGTIGLTPEGLAIPQLRELGKLKFANHLKWLYFVYSRSSPYKNLFPRERKLRTHRDQDLAPHTIEDLDNNELVLKAAKALDVEVSAPERFREGVVKQMEDLIQRWNEMGVNSDDYHRLAREMKGSKGLIELYEQYTAIGKNQKKRNRGGAETGFLEKIKDIQIPQNV